jgi:Domain of unknown function (DUF4349)
MRTLFRRTILLTLALSGCGFDRAAPARSEEYKDKVAALNAPASSPPAGVSAGFVQAAPGDVMEGTERANLPSVASDPTALPSMIIRTGQASIKVDSLELAVQMVRQLAERVGGFIANSQLQAGENQLRSATLEIKVPAARFEELTTGLAPIGKVEYINVSAQDVGEEFTDISARVTNGHRLEARLIDLLATRTGKLSDVLEIERELARVREEIERMEGRLRYLKAHVSTSSLTVTVHEKAPVIGPPGGGGVIGMAFQQAWRNFVGFLASLIASLGVLVPVAAIVIVGLLGLRKLWRARQNPAS